MEPQSEKEYLLFRNRIRRFAERLQRDESKMYRDLGITTPIRWMRVLHILDEAQIPLGITEIATKLDRSHPDIHHITIQLGKEGLIKSQIDKNDQRKRLVTITSQGEELINRLKPIWEATGEATSQWIFEQAPEFMIYLNALEDSLSRQSYHDRILDKIKENAANNIVINSFQKYPDGVPLILKFFDEWQNSYHPVLELEASLSTIQPAIVNRSSEVFFAHDHDQCVGLCVVQRLSYDILQLLFIYVRPTARRRHVGKVLMQATIDYAKDIGCKIIIAHIHRILVPVDQLLRQHKFELSRQLNKNYIPFENLPHTMVLKLNK